MAVIGKIQKRSGLIFAIVLVALAAFVLGDLLTGGGGSRGNMYLSVAVIDGEKISQREFFAQVDKQLDLLRQQTGSDMLTNAQAFQVKQQVYNTILRDRILGIEYEKLGIAVAEEKGMKATISREELLDMVYGNNPHELIIQNFRDPQTNQFNPSLVQNFINYIKQAKEGDDFEQYEQAVLQEKQWENLIDYIKNDRLNVKYNNLIKKSWYIPSTLAKHNYDLRNRVADFRFFGVRYPSIADTLAVITEQDFKKFYEENKMQYKRQIETREIDYVIFDVLPSDDDVQAIERRVMETVEGFGDVDLADISNFVNRIPGNMYDSTYIKEGSLSIYLDSVMFASEPGFLYGPYLEDNAYHIARLVDRQMRPDSMRASHILISYQGAARVDAENTRLKIHAERIADSLLTELQKTPGRFEEIAGVINDDPAAKEMDGDVEWFADGIMAYAFNEFCVNSKVGDMGVVETVFGYHIIKVTGMTTPKPKIRVAQIRFELEPSQDTYNDYWKQASQFLGDVKNINAFNDVVSREGLSKRSTNIELMSNEIPGLESPRELIQWAFNKDVSEGEVSDRIFEFGNKYVVAAVRKIKAKGIPSLDEMRDDIEVLVRRDKKAEIISGQLKDAFAKNMDFYAVAKKFNANIDTLDFIRFDFSSVRGYGPEPYLIGKVFSSTPSQMSEPVKGVQGVFVFIADGFTEAPETDDYGMTITQLKNIFQSRVENEVYQALERRATIEDNRVLFY